MNKFYAPHTRIRDIFSPFEIFAPLCGFFRWGQSLTVYVKPKLFLLFDTWAYCLKINSHKLDSHKPDAPSGTCWRQRWLPCRCRWQPASLQHIPQSSTSASLMIRQMPCLPSLQPDKNIFKISAFWRFLRAINQCRITAEKVQCTEFKSIFFSVYTVVAFIKDLMDPG